MAEEKTKTIKVAAIQMECVNGDVQANLDRADGFVNEAAERGAKLIILPEFMPNGYIYSTEIWDTGEPREGPTVQWLREHSKRLGVWLGTSYLEAEGEDFYNTFVLTNPTGEEDGRVRKQVPAFGEAYYTKGEVNPHVIDSDIGVIGVGICYENQWSFIPELMFSQGADLMLMPHSAPTPGPYVPRFIQDTYHRKLKALPTLYGGMLGIPAVMINKSGPWKSPIPGIPFVKQDSTFPGLSGVADGDGTLKAQLGPEEGLLVEDVKMDPARKTDRLPRFHGRWTTKMPWAITFFRLTEHIGSAWYRMSKERKRRALEISSKT
jgi:N-carbamoylputrescine amidase